MTRDTEGQERAEEEEPAHKQSENYLAIEGLVTLADLLPLLVAAGGDQLQYGLLVTA